MYYILNIMQKLYIIKNLKEKKNRKNSQLGIFFINKSKDEENTTPHKNNIYTRFQKTET